MTTRDEPTELEQGLLDSMKEFEETLEQQSELTKLWEISDSGKAEWWPDTVWLRKNNRPCYSHDDGYEDSPMEIDDALHIVKGHAEEWLRGRGWFRFADQIQGESWCHEDEIHGYSLPEAILAEVGRA